jgi:hypothetical protein
MDTGQKLTRKQRAFADYYLANPKTSATEAAMQTYNASNRHVAEQIAHRNMRNVEVLAYLQPFEELAIDTVLQVIRDWGGSQNPRKRELALKAAFYLHDKLWGKATTKIDIPIQVVKICIDLSNEGKEPPKEMLEDL